MLIILCSFKPISYLTNSFKIETLCNCLYIYIYIFLGDPRQDLEYERQYAQQTSYIVPDVIKNFLLVFQKAVNDQNLFEIQNAYENG